MEPAWDAGRMGYLTDRRAGCGTIRETCCPRRGTPSSAGSCTRLLAVFDAVRGSGARLDLRYAWGDDYHDVMRAGLERLAGLLGRRAGPFDWRVCVDAAPLPSAPTHAAADWGGSDAALPDKRGERLVVLPGRLLVSLELAPDAPPLPTFQAPARGASTLSHRSDCARGRSAVSASTPACTSHISLLNCAARFGNSAQRIGQHLFGCDVCAGCLSLEPARPATEDPAFAPLHFAPRSGPDGGDQRGGISRSVPPHPGLRAAMRVPPQRGYRDGERQAGDLSGAAPETGGVPGPCGGPARSMGAGRLNYHTPCNRTIVACWFDHATHHRTGSRSALAAGPLRSRPSTIPAADGTLDERSGPDDGLPAVRRAAGPVPRSPLPPIAATLVGAFPAVTTPMSCCIRGRRKG